MSKLTAKQAKFVDEYMVDLNATQAAIRAGYSEKTARQTAAENLTKPNIQKVIARRREAASESAQITVDRVVREAARLALFDPRKLFNADGTPKAIQDLDDDTAACIAGIDVMSMGSGDDIGQVMKYKLAPKGQAIETLMKHLGGYEKDNAQKAKSLQELIAEVREEK